MQYMLLIMGKEGGMAPAPVGDTNMSPEYHAFNQALVKAGVMRGGERLRPTAAARRVRVRDGKATVLAGPYADTEEQLGGYYIIEVTSDEEALEWAQQCPAAKTGTIEVRPVWPTRPL